MLPVSGPVAGDRAPPDTLPHLRRVTFPFLAPSRLWTAKEASGRCSLFRAQRAASAAAFPSAPPASRTKARPAGAPCPLPAVPPAHISPRGDELCMAHRSGGDCSYSRRGLRVW